MSSSFSMKGGWQPKGKDGTSKESWRGDFKGINQVAGWMGKGKETSEPDRKSEKSDLKTKGMNQVAGWMGKGKDTTEQDRRDHVSQPLSSLKDPSSFAPPPKHINYHGAAAVNETTPDRRGIGAPLSREQIAQQHQEEAQQQAEAEKPKPPPVPYRVDTTGLSTNNLPPPPRRLDSPGVSTTPTSAKPKPQIPPRVPPRNPPPPSQSPSPPPAYSAEPPSPSKGYLNQGATSRLSKAGVSVPAFGIGGKSEPSSASGNGSTVDKLQSKFSQMRTDSGLSSASSPATASPAATPAPYPGDSELAPLPGFRDRHADKIDMGKQKFGGLTSRINTFVDDQKFSANANKRMPRPPASSASASPVASSPSASIETQAQRKKPPPPPPKKAGIRAPAAAPNADSPGSSASTPPPIPMSTKPR